MPPVELLREDHPEEPVLDMALTHALLDEVAAGLRPGAARVFRPGATLAFGRLDALAPRFAAAAAAAGRHGFTPLLRLGGGHAVAYDRGSVQLDVVTPQAGIYGDQELRYVEATELVVEALQTVGVDARRGELPGEYCAGRWSVHAGGVKLAGTSQRAIRGATLLSAVVVVEGGARVRAALTAVYQELGLTWEPATAGAADDLVPGLRAADVQESLIGALAARFPLTPGTVGPATVDRARALTPRHVVTPPA